MTKEMANACAEMDILVQHVMSDAIAKEVLLAHKLQEHVLKVARQTTLEKRAKGYASVKMAFAMKILAAVTVKILIMVTYVNMIVNV